jgi:hypothetical protein
MSDSKKITRIPVNTYTFDKFKKIQESITSYSSTTIFLRDNKPTLMKEVPISANMWKILISTIDNFMEYIRNHNITFISIDSIINLLCNLYRLKYINVLIHNMYKRKIEYNFNSCQSHEDRILSDNKDELKCCVNACYQLSENTIKSLLILLIDDYKFDNINNRFKHEFFRYLIDNRGLSNNYYYSDINLNSVLEYYFNKENNNTKLYLINKILKDIYIELNILESQEIDKYDYAKKRKLAQLKLIKNFFVKKIELDFVINNIKKIFFKEYKIPDDIVYNIFSFIIKN